MKHTPQSTAEVRAKPAATTAMVDTALRVRRLVFVVTSVGVVAALCGRCGDPMNSLCAHCCIPVCECVARLQIRQVGRRRIVRPGFCAARHTGTDAARSHDYGVRGDDRAVPATNRSSQYQRQCTSTSRIQRSESIWRIDCFMHRGSVRVCNRWLWLWPLPCSSVGSTPWHRLRSGKRKHFAFLRYCVNAQSTLPQYIVSAFLASIIHAASTGGPLYFILGLTSYRTVDLFGLRGRAATQPVGSRAV